MTHTRTRTANLNPLLGSSGGSVVQIVSTVIIACLSVLPAAIAETYNTDAAGERPAPRTLTPLELSACIDRAHEHERLKQYQKAIDDYSEFIIGWSTILLPKFGSFQNSDFGV